MRPALARPRALGLLCGAGAVGIGIVYLAAAGAPARYLLVNSVALLLGVAAWAAAGRVSGLPLAGAGPAVLALAFPLLLTAFLGVSIEGASRWVRIGPLNLQVSLVLLPAMVVLFARRPDAVGAVGMTVAAVALALQPDRAMAGALAAGLIGLLPASPGRLPVVAAAAALLAFASTLVQPDRLPATPHVEGVFSDAFDLHPLAGVAVMIGAAVLLVPSFLAISSGSHEAAPLLALGGCWLGVIAAAALGNYPTPLVGYGGSAVLGYLLSAALLPKLDPENACPPR